MPSLCLVVPCYNEAARLDADAFLRWLDASPDCSVCFVDDGSIDDTRARLEALARQRPAQVHVHALPANGGKAEAVRQGLLAMAAQQRWSVLGYWDADLSTTLDQVTPMHAALNAQPSAVLAVGSRQRRAGARIERRWSRHVAGRAFASAVRVLLGIHLYDTQCGAKLVRADAVTALCAAPFLTRWIFDVELLVRLRQQHAASISARVIEVPLAAWRDVAGSKLRAADMLQAPRELWAIRQAYRRG